MNLNFNALVELKFKNFEQYTTLFCSAAKTQHLRAKYGTN